MPPLIEALLAQLENETRDGAVELIETHISWVLLTPQLAFKIKKPVRLPFADFSTLERRRRCCEDELRLNRRLAPALYLDVVPIGGSPERPVIGAEPAIEFAVKMRRFPDAARLDRALAAGRVTRTHMREFARDLARFHGVSPAAGTGETFGAAATVAAEAKSNVRDLRAALGDTAAVVTENLDEWIERQLVRLQASFAERQRAGAVRDGHGDLHVENLALLDDRLVAFDCLEFAAELRWADVASEIAFLTMDLVARGYEGLAFEFLDAYLEATGAYGALRVFPFYAVHRALVRAKVAAIRAAQSQAPRDDSVERYLGVAKKLTRPGTPWLVLTHGLSGSGKTTVAGVLVSRLPCIRIRSDVERKRLAGLSAQAASGSPVAGGLYGQDMGQRTYAHLLDCARLAVEAGISIVVDAAFLLREQRAPFRALAEELQAHFTILDCRAPEAVLRARIAARRAQAVDASEATESVLEHQLRTHEPLDADERVRVVAVDCAAPIDPDAVYTTVVRSVRSDESA